MGKLVIEDFKGVDFDQNAAFFTRNNVEQILDQSIVKMQIGGNYHVAETINDIIQNKAIFYYKNKREMLGVAGDEIVEITDQFVERAASAFRLALDTFISDYENKPIDPQELGKLLVFFNRINMLGVKNSVCEKCKNDLMRYIRERSLKSDEDLRNVSDGVSAFMRDSIETSMDKNAKVQNTEYDLKNGKYVSFMTNLFISEFVKNELINYHYLEETGIIDAMSDEELSKIYIDKGIFDSDDLVRAIMRRKGIKNEFEALEYLYKTERKNFLKVLTPEDAVAFMVMGKFESERERNEALKLFKPELLFNIRSEFLEDILSTNLSLKHAPFLKQYPELGEGIYIDREIMKKLSRRQLLTILFSKNVLYKIPLSSEELVNMFNPDVPDDIDEQYKEIEEDLEKNDDQIGVKGFNFGDIVYLCKKEKIKNADVIKIFKHFNSLDYTNRFKMICELCAFYDMDKLKEMFDNNEINGRFVENFNNLVNSQEFDDTREVYMDMLREQIEAQDDREGLYLSLLKTGLDLDIGLTVSTGKISDLYLEGVYSENDIISFYNKGIISLDVIRELLTDEEIIEKFNNGIFDYRVLNALSEKTINVGSLLEDGKIDLSQLIRLFADKDGLNIEELKEISQLVSLEGINVAELLPDDISPEKIEELARNWFISHDNLSELVEREMLTREKAEELAEEIASHEMYESIFGQDGGIIVLSAQEEQEGKKGSSRKNIDINLRTKQLKNNPRLQEQLFDDLGFDGVGRIRLTGVKNSLDGYSVYSSEELGVVVFMKSDRPNNATYVMSVQQALYTLANIRREDNIISEKLKSGETIVRRTDATKQAIRNTEHVKVINASRNWGENIIDAMNKVSKKSSQKLTKKSPERKELEGLLDEIREDYDRRRYEDYE